LKDALNRVEEEHHAIIFSYNSNRQKFGKYITEKENEIIQKKDPFPKTVEDMCRVLAGWKNDNKHNRAYDANDGVVLATADAGTRKGKGKNKKVTCFKCKKQGHYTNECNEENTDDEDDSTKKKTTNKKGSKFMNQGKYDKKKTGNEENSKDSDKGAESSDDDYKFAFLQHDVACTVQDKVAIPKTWILLDSQSTVDVFSNPKLLTNIRDAKRDLTLYCNAGKAIINKKGDLKG